MCGVLVWTRKTTSMAAQTVTAAPSAHKSDNLWQKRISGPNHVPNTEIHSADGQLTDVETVHMHNNIRQQHHWIWIRIAADQHVGSGDASRERSL